MLNRSKFIVLVCISIFAQISNVKAENTELAKATEKLNTLVLYTPKYVKIPYPNGDVDERTGVCTDVVIRAYRELGIDLQQLVHEDMKKNFKLYPKNWGLTRTDTNIDHRRVPNLQVFFSRFGKLKKITKNPADYETGDIVTWKLSNGAPHIGIILEEKSKNGTPLVFHNIVWTN
ncbi:MAG: DUF1287 domain-containing protein [Alphaproteobacteria bacterium]